MKKKTLAKLRSQSGESIAETLIALLISSLALVMLAGAVGSASRVITTSNAKMAEYYSMDNKLAEQKAEKADGSVTVSIEGNYSIKQQTDSVSYRFFLNDAFGNTPVIAYGKSS